MKSKEKEAIRYVFAKGMERLSGDESSSGDEQMLMRGALPVVGRGAYGCKFATLARPIVLYPG
jgi:hypothetical protein